MHKEILVAELEIDEENTGLILQIPAVFDWEHLPVGVTERTVAGRREVEPHSLNEWWAGRAIPASRSGLREALEILNVSQTVYLLTKCFGLSLSDQYWVNKSTHPLDWEKVNFFQNEFSEDVGNALFGRYSGGEISLLSPDNTSDGWLQKKWVIADGKRVLLKGGSEPFFQEPLNEVIASALMRRLGIPHAAYTLAWEHKRPLSACEDFITVDTDLVSAWHIMSGKPFPWGQSVPPDFPLYEYFLGCCAERGIPGVRESLDRMLVIDFLMVNTDRHFKNFGAVRNADTLEWIGLSPIFDTGTSLWHNQLTRLIDPVSGAPSKPFKRDHGAQISLVSSFDWLDLRALDGVDEECREILRQSPVYIDEERRERLCAALNMRIALLAKGVDETNA
jgi:hypothetical protein